VTTTLWATLGLVLVIDLVVIAVRAGYFNFRSSQLTALREINPITAERAKKTLENPNFSAAIRFNLGLVRFVFAGILLFIVESYLPNGEMFWLYFVILAAALCLLMVMEFGIERMVLQNMEKWVLRLMPFGEIINLIFYPIASLLTTIVDVPDAFKPGINSVTEDEIRNWAEVDLPEGELETEERRMIYSIFQFGETLCREIMVPRIDVVALDVNATIHEVTKTVIDSGHSRLPVYEDSIDNIIGLLYAKDLLEPNKTTEKQYSLRDMLRPAYFVPEAKKVDKLLKEMQARGIHMSVVVDEYGGMAGVVTLEDIVEEIVGEIRDEYDESEELLFHEISPREFLFHGRIDLDDLNEIIDTDLTKDVADTLGGFLYGEIGRVPSGGEVVHIDGWTLTVQQVSGRRIVQVRAEKTTEFQKIEEESKNDAEH
jgi:CBS domain containing-hemolysin-like protein